MSEQDRTISYVEDRDDEERSFVAPYLVLAFQCTHPTALPQRLSLAEVEHVIIGRASVRGYRRYVERGRNVLRIDVADSWMSASHVAITRRGPRWMLTDDASKNGTFINGAAVAHRSLHDGDLIEAGNTMLLFRSDVERHFNEPPDVGPLELQQAPPAFATLSSPLARQFHALQRFAPSRVPVLICGETGTGKEVTAKALHERSGRDGRFVAINCGAIAQNLVESQLFGHRKGAFSGAVDDHVGLIRAADRGTLLLDEIAELPEASQVKLLRVLNDHEVMPVGGTKPIKVDIRVLAATHQDLDERIERGEFRRDLYARLAGHVLVLPPLRERREDLGLLIAHLLPRMLEQRADAVFQRPAARALFQHDWSLNIRELEQALRAAVALADKGPVGIDHLPAAIRRAAPEVAGRRSTGAEDDELRVRLSRLLETHAGNVSAVARELGKARVQVRRWCKRFDLEPEAYRR